MSISDRFSKIKDLPSSRDSPKGRNPRMKGPTVEFKAAVTGRDRKPRRDDSRGSRSRPVGRDSGRDNKRKQRNGSPPRRGGRGGRGRGRGGKGNNGRKDRKKPAPTIEDLNKEMDDYRSADQSLVESDKIALDKELDDYNNERDAEESKEEQKEETS